MDRKEEITHQYFALLDQHLHNIIHGKTTEMMELNEIAAALCISHKHLTSTVKQTTGHHPCHFYDIKIIEHAKQLLVDTDWPAARIAQILTYDPSNFSKFFKKFTGCTPGRFRKL